MDRISRKKIPDEMNNGRNIPVQAAIEANPPPRASDPITPKSTDAL